MTKMKLLALLFIGIIQFSEEKSTALETPTAGSTADDESSTVTDSLVTLEPGDTAKTVSPTEKVVKNSSVADTPPENIQLPVDLLSDDILLDPSVILARAERSVGGPGTVQVPGPIGNSLDADQFEDDIPTFYFVRFVRVPRSAVDPKLEPEKDEHFRMPEEPDKTVRRFSRSATEDEAEDLHGAEDGFVIRPLFKYRREQSRKSNRRGYRNRDTYSYYPRYPIFPGK